MASVRTRIADGGRVVIPAEFRKALGLCVGDPVLLILENGGVTLVTPDEAIRQARAIVREHVPEGRSLVDELIAERRAEAARE